MHISYIYIFIYIYISYIYIIYIYVQIIIYIYTVYRYGCTLTGCLLIHNMPSEVVMIPLGFQSVGSGFSALGESFVG